MKLKKDSQALSKENWERETTEIQILKIKILLENSPLK